MSAPQDKASGKLWDDALDAQHAFGDLDGHRPELLGVHDAVDDDTAYGRSCRPASMSRSCPATRSSSTTSSCRTPGGPT
ncbi:hypothetical protein [Streptomyces sp. NPDC006334]|uniref:hypothetical protein n=1 Tax=Streptomyces sp. NPDC006334 TaxID=3156754 RepID=UPI0033B9DF20